MNDYLDMLKYGNRAVPQQSLIGDPIATPELSFGKKASHFLFGETNHKTGATTTGFALPALSAIAGIGNAYLGMKQYGLAKDTFKFQKKAWERDFAVQKNMVNSEMNDRQNSRYVSNPGAYQTPDAYMSKWGVK